MSTPGELFHGPPIVMNNGHRYYRGQIYRLSAHKRKLFSINPMSQLCKKPIATLEEATLDHIIPRYHGGHTTKDNVQLAHKVCNEKKGNSLTFDAGMLAAD